VSPQILSANDREVAIYLTTREADELSTCLRKRLDKVSPGFSGPAWHMHLEDDDGREVVIGVLDDDATQAGTD
jgi:hypothetical protein